MALSPHNALPFESIALLDAWLEANHAGESELWVRIYKKGSGTPSVDWGDCVVAAIAWGWIDGQRKSLDEVSFIQRLTPRRARSNWSKRNCEHAERLIADGGMRPAGMVHVEAARADGRWERAYAGSADMVLPEEFLRALAANPAAQERFATLTRAKVFAIYHPIQTAKRAETRTKRIAAAVAELAEGGGGV
ncbi:MAG: YdeI/OmpD-associated family protein [Myxococcota bacterium]